MSRITESARGEQCTVMLPFVQFHDPETVVFAHANDLRLGKGVGHKATLKQPNGKFWEFGCYACFYCHNYIDAVGGRTLPPGWLRQDIKEYEAIARDRTLQKLISKGLVGVF